MYGTCETLCRELAAKYPGDAPLMLVIWPKGREGGVFQPEPKLGAQLKAGRHALAISSS